MHNDNPSLFKTPGNVCIVGYSYIGMGVVADNDGAEYIIYNNSITLGIGLFRSFEEFSSTVAIPHV